MRKRIDPLAAADAGALRANPNLAPYYCPGCGQKTLRIIEEVITSIDSQTDVCTCDHCGNMVHIFRSIDPLRDSPERG